MLSVESRLCALIDQLGSLERGTAAEKIDGFQHFLDAVDDELEAAALSTEQRREFGRLRRKAGLLLADTRAWTVLARKCR